jgi:RimJ/RimL family protein N-acetyltransferase
MRAFLRTRRMVLRRMTEADVDNPFRLNSDPQVMRYLTGGAAARASRSATVAETTAANAPSRRVMQKCGMTLARTYPWDGTASIEGSELGGVEYLLTRADWLAGRSGGARRHGSDDAR